MIYHTIIIELCDKYNLGNDVATIIESFVIQACCSALPIKKELQKLVDYTFSFHSLFDFIDHRKTGYYESRQPGFSFIARNIIGSFGISVGKENYIDYVRLGNYLRLDFVALYLDESIIHYFRLAQRFMKK